MGRHRLGGAMVLVLAIGLWWYPVMVWGQAGPPAQAGPAPQVAPPPEAGSAPEAGPESVAPAVTEEPKPQAPQVQGVQAEKPAEPTEKPVGRVGRITFNFRGASLDSVIEAVAEASGLDFIKTADVGGTVTIVNHEQLSVDEALNVLGEVLRVRGATLLRSGNRVTIIPLADARWLTTKVLQGKAPEEVPDTSEIIHWIEPLRYVDAARLARDLIKLMPAYGNLAANSESQTLIITDTAANVKRLLTIIKAVDNPQVTTATVRIFALQNASAVDLVTPLTKLFTTPETQASTQARMQRFQMMAQQSRANQQPGGGGAPSGIDIQEPSERQQPRIVADDRTNSLIVTASGEMLTIIEGVVTQLDAEASGSLLDLRVFILKNADAQDVAQVVQNVFSPTAQGGRGRQPGQGQGPMLRFRTSDAAGVEGGPTAALKDTVKVGVDKRTNAVVVMATADNLEIIGQLIMQLDEEAAATPQSVAIIPLDNAEPGDIASVLEGILATDTQQVRVRRPAGTQARQGGAQATGQRGGGGTTTTGTTTTRTGTTQPRTGGTGGGGRTGGGGTGGGGGGGGPRGEAPSPWERAFGLAPPPTEAGTASVPGLLPTIEAIAGLAPSMAISPGGPAILAQERRLDVLSGGPAPAPAPRPAAAPPTAGPRSEAMLLPQLTRPRVEEGQAINITYDDRTGALIVSAPEGTLDLIRGIVSRLDADPAEKYRSIVYRLNNANATDLAAVLNRMFTAGAVPGAAGIATELRGGVIIVPDTRTNSLILTTAPRNYDLLLPILEDLDRAPAQVLIQVLLAEVTLDKSLDLGLNFATWNQLGVAGGQPPSEFGVGGTTLFYSIINRNLAGFLNFLQSTGKLDILSRPQILASDNQPAQINVGQQVPFVTRVQFTDAGNTISTIEYQDIGIILTVTPHVNPAGSVNMVITAENSSIAESTIAISEQVQAAVFNRELATTTVSIQDGETIVIGGLIQNTVNKQVSKIPLLGDIPILGDIFFKSVSNKDEKKELLVILTPRVVRTKEALAKLSEEEKARTKNLLASDIIELTAPIPSPQEEKSTQ